MDSVEEIRRVYVNNELTDRDSNLDLRSVPSRNRNPFDPGFEEFDPILREESSLLFIPTDHPRTSSDWKDLRSNDVTVNWLTVDTDPDNEGAPPLVVLSDWVADLGNDVPPTRSTGVATGIVHLTAETLEIVGGIACERTGFASVLSTFLDDPAHKLRPCFLRERD